jgi:hypothetical protein
MRTLVSVLISALILGGTAEAVSRAGTPEQVARCALGFALERSHPVRDLSKEEYETRHRLSQTWLRHPVDPETRVRTVLSAYGGLIEEAEAEIRAADSAGEVGKGVFYRLERKRLQENMASFGNVLGYADERTALLAPYSSSDRPPLFPTHEYDQFASKLEQVNRKRAKTAKTPYLDWLLERLPGGMSMNQGRILSLKEIGAVAEKDYSFVVFPDQTMTLGISHIPMGGGAAMASAGEISVRLSIDRATGKPVVEEVQLNLKSGTYQIPDGITAFRAAVQAVLKAGIVPKRFVLKDFESGNSLQTQKPLVTLEPPFR